MSSKSVVAFIGHVDPHRFFQRHILLRVDYNVPLKKIYPGEEILVASDSRILDSLPTIKFLLAKEAKLVICSHLGRPKGPQDHELSLRPVAKHLSRLLGDVKIEFFTECIGPEVEERIIQQKPRTVIVLENLRFHSGEEANDDRFARLLAQNMDIFVNDAFSVCHRGK
jgi:phosphoglycerate kinase